MAIALFLLAANLCRADDTVRLTPGLWEVRTTTRLPELSQSLSRETTSCLQSSAMDPTEVFENTRQCSVSEKKLDGNAMTWLVACTVPGKGNTHGNGAFTSHGDHAEGSTTLRMFHRGREIAMIATWSGRLIGPCP
ncbi:MAG: DUF3617 domain-containing protein [Gammaproteobacteria bacterium]